MAALDTCSDTNLTTFFSGPGLDMLISVASVVIQNIYSVFFFLAISSHVYAGVDTPIWAVLMIYASYFILGFLFTFKSIEIVAGGDIDPRRLMGKVGILTAALRILVYSGCAKEERAPVDCSDHPISEEISDRLSAIALAESETQGNDGTIVEHEKSKGKVE
eukprot:CAMPEP_0184317454 /NCGR_PEP_ID=MMETSP1049-20130417/96782_1 /TAXON_ID=77928 /ORGANISM="Proteomonas sulcata, Strain CCMP704" /LENGTH=161 /DNA_ID=CAMNT_0026636839 /DNA_START=290 /DNA_END=775 /DNA_ORIENTATION=+